MRKSLGRASSSTRNGVISCALLVGLITCILGLFCLFLQVSFIMASFRLKSAIAIAVFLKKENKSMASIAQWRHFVCIISCALSPFRVHCCFFVSTRFFFERKIFTIFFLQSGIGQQFKARHFVCTHAGFLHYFDSKVFFIFYLKKIF